MLDMVLTYKSLPTWPHQIKNLKKHIGYNPEPVQKPPL